MNSTIRSNADYNTISTQIEKSKIDSVSIETNKLNDIHICKLSFELQWLYSTGTKTIFHIF